MSRVNKGPNNPAKRGVGGHIMEGLKNVPKMYDALYNAKGPNGAKLGVKNTVAANVRTVATGKSSPVLPAKPASTRAKLAAVGASSVTPLGPLVAIGMGINKSVQDKKAAQNKAAGKPSAAAPAKAALKPAPKAGPAASKPAAKPPLTPSQKAAAQKATALKKTLNEAIPGLNMK